jgi:hypothetical protein
MIITISADTVNGKCCVGAVTPRAQGTGLTAQLAAACLTQPQVTNECVVLEETRLGPDVPVKPPSLCVLLREECERRSRGNCRSNASSSSRSEALRTAMGPVHQRHAQPIGVRRSENTTNV